MKHHLQLLAALVLVSSALVRSTERGQESLFKSPDPLFQPKNEKGEWVVRDDVQISFKVGDKVLKSATSTCETCGGMANSGCFVRGFTG